MISTTTTNFVSSQSYKRRIYNVSNVTVKETIMSVSCFLLLLLIRLMIPHKTAFLETVINKTPLALDLTFEI